MDRRKRVRGRRQCLRRRRIIRIQSLLLCSFLISKQWVVVTNGFQPHHHSQQQQQHRKRSFAEQHRDPPPTTNVLRTPPQCSELFAYATVDEIDVLGFDSATTSQQQEGDGPSDSEKKEDGGSSLLSNIRYAATSVMDERQLQPERNGFKQEDLRFLPPSSNSDGRDVENNGTTGTTSTATVASTNKKHRSMWRRREARSAEEGIRREKTTQLSTILAKAAAAVGKDSAALRGRNRRYAARTITGLIHAVAEEVRDLEVEVDARDDTPLWDKHVDEIRIKFSRLGFKPLRISGHSSNIRNGEQQEILHHAEDGDNDSITYTAGRQLTDLSCPDEAFSRMDVDNSGALDRDEIVEALTLAAGAGQVATASTDSTDDDVDSSSSSPPSQENGRLAYFRRLASELVALYDFNGDGVVDRLEYQSMVEDMASLREAQEKKEREMEEKQREEEQGKDNVGWFSYIGSFVSGLFRRNGEAVDNGNTVKAEEGTKTARERVSGDGSLSAPLRDVNASPEGAEFVSAEVVDESKESVDSGPKYEGSITLSDLKLDLRRLVFGAIPILKHITPGGPLVLEPFTATITGSFSRDDIMNSFLLDLGLRRLVAQALKRRVRSLRDVMDFAVFYGRSWKMFDKAAPSVEVLELTNVEFDKNSKMIITGRVRVQSRQDQPVVENAFKLRTKIGTKLGGRLIRLVEPELALVFECPRQLEDSIGEVCNVFGIKKPVRPQPIYSFFPIYSPFKLDDNAGFDLGDDNRIKSIYVEDNALRFELSAVLRPGRFLGNHYLAFTLPIRTFIITLERVKEGMRAARKAKKARKALKEAAERSIAASSSPGGGGGIGIDDAEPPAPGLIDDLEIVRQKRPPEDRNNGALLPRIKKPKSFFSRFVDGYLQAPEDADHEKVTTAIRDFFGRQGLGI